MECITNNFIKVRKKVRIYFLLDKIRHTYNIKIPMLSLVLEFTFFGPREILSKPIFLHVRETSENITDEIITVGDPTSFAKQHSYNYLQMTLYMINSQPFNIHKL